MQIGSIIQYRLTPGEQPVAGVVTHIWEDGQLQLHLFHHNESSTLVRAAHPSQVVEIYAAPVIPPDPVIPPVEPVEPEEGVAEAVLVAVESTKARKRAWPR